MLIVRSKYGRHRKTCLLKLNIKQQSMSGGKFNPNLTLVEIMVTSIQCLNGNMTLLFVVGNGGGKALYSH